MRLDSRLYQTLKIYFDYFDHWSNRGRRKRGEGQLGQLLPALFCLFKIFSAILKTVGSGWKIVHKHECLNLLNNRSIKGEDLFHFLVNTSLLRPKFEPRFKVMTFFLVFVRLGQKYVLF